jgi:hypothetical protein
MTATEAAPATIAPSAANLATRPPRKISARPSPIAIAPTGTSR